MASLDRDFYSRCVRLLIAARKASGITQVQLAEKLGQRQTFISKVELEERRLDVGEFVLFCRAIGVDPTELICGAEEASRDC